MPENMKADTYRSLEEAGIDIREATEADLASLEAFLSRPDIDSLFTPALSNPVRGISIADRVKRKFTQGVWMVSVHHGSVVGCMAVVPSSLPLEVPSPDPEKNIKVSEGVSFASWNVDHIKELSTVVTDRNLRDTLRVKGVGAELLNKTKVWVKNHGKGTWGFVTDSWVGGDMGGFIDAMNSKAYAARCQEKGLAPMTGGFDGTLVRIYTDPPKRGAGGPPTVVYGIPIEDRDWEFFISHQPEIRELNKLYTTLEAQYA